MPDGQDNTKGLIAGTTKIEQIVKGEKSEWKKEYDKDGITIHSDPIFGRVKLTTPKGSIVDKDIAAIGGVVAFGEYYQGGIGELKAYHPYVAMEVLNALRGR